jgi:UreE urease accessory protein, N-terminal domain
MRRVTDKGTQIALVMPRGSHLRDGDVVFLTSEKSGGARGVSYSAVFTQESY